MGYRDAAPDGRKDRDGRPTLVLPQGTSLAGKYQTSYLGVGGMSIVYKGYREGKTYFIKEVDAHNSQLVISLSQEKFMLERLNHPGIVKIHDFFEQEGFCYLVTDYIDGKSLNRLISPLPDVFIQEKIVLDWARQLYDIFEYLHNQKPPIIYRDLKPQNVIRDKEGKIFLVDFGIARTFKEDSIGDTTPMGSFLTASPEHYGGKQTDERSDIYTLGATLHYLLTNGKGRGTDLFDFSPPRNINPKISEKTEKIIMKALSLDPSKRFASIDEMRKAHFNSVGSEMIMEAPATSDDEDAIALKRSGRPASDESSAMKGPAESENVFQSFMNFALSQPRLIAVFVGILILITASAVVLKSSTRQKAVAVSSPEVMSSPVLAPSQDSAAMTGGSPEPGASPSASPLVPAPGYTLVIGSSARTAKPTSVIVTPSATVVMPTVGPTITGNPAYPITSNTPKQHIARNTQNIPTQEPAGTGNIQPTPVLSTKEDVLSKIFSLKRENIKPVETTMFFDPGGNYSLKLPNGYYRLQSGGSIRFASIDNNLDTNTIRVLTLNTINYKGSASVSGETAISSMVAAKINAGATILEQDKISRVGSERIIFQGFHMAYSLEAPALLQKYVENPFIFNEYYFTSNNDLVYQFTACAPEVIYNKYSSSEFQPFFDSIYITEK